MNPLIILEKSFHYIAQIARELLGSSDPPDSAFEIARTTGMHLRARLSGLLTQTELGYSFLISFWFSSTLSAVSSDTLEDLD